MAIAERTAPRDLALAGHLWVCLFAFCLAQSMLIPAVSSMRQDFDASATAVGWTMSANLVVTAVATLVIGRLSDVLPRRVLLLACMAAFFGGGVVAVAGDAITWVVLGRAVQGLGGGVYPLVFGLVAAEVSPRRVSTASGVLAGSIGIGGGLGLPLGGILVDHGGVLAVLGAVTTLALLGLVSAGSLRVLLGPEPPRGRPGRVRADPSSVVLLTAAVLALVAGLGQLSSHGWRGAGMPLLLVSAALAAAFTVRQIRARSPLVDLTTMRLPTLVWTNTSTFLVGLLMFGSMIAVTAVGQLDRADGGLGLTATRASLLLLPASACVLVGSALATRGVPWLGVGRTLVIGAAAAAAGASALAGWHGSPAAVAALLGACYVGVGVVYAVVPWVVTLTAPPDGVGEAHGVNTLSRLVGSAVGAQVVTAAVTGGAAGSPSPQQGYALLAGVAVAGLLTSLQLRTVQREPVAA